MSPGRMNYCKSCDRVWVGVIVRKGSGPPEYFTREDLAFYGMKDRECKPCSEVNLASQNLEEAVHD